MPNIGLSQLRKAFSSLQEGYRPNPSELERDGIIQRFEFTVELCWKTSKKILAENSITVDVPKNVFRELAQLGWIDNAEIWMEFINARNKASHIYNEQVAQEVFSVIPGLLIEAKKLIDLLESKIK